uniref:Hypothetical 21 kDa protein n=1 Tax=Mycobacterium genavense TaxID=36812 RepID=O31034_MYCGN|nr:hypothetical 21 kDa protein [Mycobacterium genavense]
MNTQDEFHPDFSASDRTTLQEASPPHQGFGTRRRHCANTGHAAVCRGQRQTGRSIEPVDGRGARRGPNSVRKSSPRRIGNRYLHPQRTPRVRVPRRRPGGAYRHGPRRLHLRPTVRAASGRKPRPDHTGGGRHRPHHPGGDRRQPTGAVRALTEFLQAVAEPARNSHCSLTRPRTYIIIRKAYDQLICLG